MPPRNVTKAVRLIREQVKRPRDLPKPYNIGHPFIALRFKGMKCPLGLLPNALESAPIDEGSFKDSQLTQQQIEAFANWWDRLPDPKAAVEELWPSK